MGYRKGAKAERELAEMLWSRGYAVIRAAGSGVGYAPDVVAIKSGKIYAFECKAWKKREIIIPRHQRNKMVEWGRRSGAEVFVAWKYPYRGWFIVPVELLSERNGAYVLTIDEAQALDYSNLLL